MPGMLALDLISASCGVVVCNTDGAFRHLASAWSVGGGDWVSAWSEEDLATDVDLMLIAAGGDIVPVTDLEHADGVAGFHAELAVPGLAIAQAAALRKRMLLEAVGYPCVIDHPAFALSHGSLNAERYLPYLCPWRISGHLALFSADDGYLTGDCHAGMPGGPVLDETGLVVGMVVEGFVAPGQVPLTRFRRLG